jgi:cytochrome c556
MKIYRFVTMVAGVLLLTLQTPAQAAGEREVAQQLPPASIAQWYKPQNKRQVWLHTMFGLRRSMQAIEIYVALQDGERLEKWSSQFLKRYRSIAEMVPEWSDEVELQWAERLEQAVAARQWEQIGTALGKLGMSCRSCHQDYRATTAALYRAPRFDAVTVEDSETLEALRFHDAMEGVTLAMNGFKIAVEDGRQQAAEGYLQQFTRRVGDLGSSCSHCHQQDRVPVERILGAKTTALLAELAELLQGDHSSIGRKLGEVGVVVCARCHGVHRTLSDLTGNLQR